MDTKNIARSFIKECCSLVGSACVYSVIRSSFRNVLPKPNKTAGRVAQFIGTVVISSMVEAKAEEFVRDWVDDCIDAYDNIKKQCDNIKAEEHNMSTGNDEFTLTPTKLEVQTSSTERAVEIGESMNSIINAKGYATMHDLEDILFRDDPDKTGHFTDERYGWKACEYEVVKPGEVTTVASEHITVSDKYILILPRPDYLCLED